MPILSENMKCAISLDLPVLNCKPTEVCSQVCYACQGRQFYRNAVVKSLAVNRLITKDPEHVARKMVDEAYGRPITERVQLAKHLLERDEGFVSLAYSDFTPLYFRWHEGLDRFVETTDLDDGKLVFLDSWDTSWIPNEAYHEVELSTMVVLPDSLYWECRPKSASSTLIRTEALQKEHLQRILRRRRGH